MLKTKANSKGFEYISIAKKLCFAKLGQEQLVIVVHTVEILSQVSGDIC